MPLRNAHRIPTFLAAALLASTACAKPAATKSDTATAMAPAPAATTSALTPIRGTIAVISDTALSVTTATGLQQVHIDAPLTVYARSTSDLAHVTPNSFVGITSVAQPDGSERATEIHIFPEALRGTGEGSRMMEQTAANDSANRMTNGTAKPSRMTNGNVASTNANAAKSGGSRMTNGSITTTGGGTKYTVQYQGGTQTIDIPSDVTVTMIAATDTKLIVGTSVIVLAHTATDGKLSASGVMISTAVPTK